MTQRTMPPLSDPIRRRLIRLRLKALVLDGADPHEAYLASYFCLIGVVYAWPGVDTSVGTQALRLVRGELGGDAFMAAVHLPLGILLAGCTLRPLIASVTLHRAVLLTAVGISLFIAVTAFLSFPLGLIGASYLLLALLSIFTFIRLDRL